MNEWQRIALEIGTDKGVHTYMPIYERFLGPISDRPLRVLEMGIDHGRSLVFWLKMLPYAEIHAIDLMECKEISDPRLTLYQRFQQDPAIALLFEPESLDVIIDDAGHEAPWQRASVNILWPCLKQDGLYFIEDILTDAYPREFANWQGDVDYLYGEKNCRNLYESYDRADCLVVLKKKHRRDKRVPPLISEACLHPKWPTFFRYMEEQADPPLTGKFVKCPGFYWGWLQYEEMWRPMWEAFRGVV